MIFKNLYINIIVRVVLIAATSFLFFFANQKYHDIIINVNLGVLFVIQVILLIRRLNYINRDLIAFFDSIKYDDSSILLSNELQDINYLRLSRRLQIVNKQIQQLKEQNTKQDQYFKTLTDIANIGLISFAENGEIRLANKAIKDLLGLENLSNIRGLDNLYTDFSDTLLKLKPSEHKIIALKNNKEELLQLSVRLTDFRTNEENLKIVSIHNIKSELDEKELEAWQKLIRILRHEIMNSIGPISSTIDTLNELIIDPETNNPYLINEINNNLITDISEGLKIIKERNTGLQRFVDNFRTISKLPNPVFEQIKVESLFSEIRSFWKNELENKSIHFNYKIEKNDLEIIADKSQIEQIIINLIKNSIEACSKHITLIAFISDEKINIEIKDDGEGIQKEVIDDIFLPFYTTKEQGSGIGLSLARQIMRLHGGSISVESVPATKTTFTLTF